MNNNNLINPITPSGYRLFNRWVYSSFALVIFLMCGLMYYTVVLYHSYYVLQKKLHKLHSPALEQMNQKKIELMQKINTLQSTHQKMNSWTQGLGYHKYLTAISAAIPDDVALTSISFENDDVLLEGKTEKIESVLPFIHALEKNKCYKHFSLMQINASHEAKNLVNFLLKGKLLK